MGLNEAAALIGPAQAKLFGFELNKKQYNK